MIPENYSHDTGKTTGQKYIQSNNGIRVYDKDTWDKVGTFTKIMAWLSSSTETVKIQNKEYIVIKATLKDCVEGGSDDASKKKLALKLTHDKVQQIINENFKETAPASDKPIQPNDQLDNRANTASPLLEDLPEIVWEDPPKLLLDLGESIKIFEGASSEKNAKAIVKIDDQVVGQIQCNPINPRTLFVETFQIKDPENRQKVFDALCQKAQECGKNLVIRDTSINLNDGIELFSSKATREKYDVSVELKEDGAHYTFTEKSGDTKPLNREKIPDDQLHYIARSLFCPTSQNPDVDPIGSALLNALYQYLYAFPEDREKLKETIGDTAHVSLDPADRPLTTDERKAQHDAQEQIFVFIHNKHSSLYNETSHKKT